MQSPLTRKYDLSSLRGIVSGAAPLGAETEREITKKFPQYVGVVYTCVAVLGAIITTSFCPFAFIFDSFFFHEWVT